LQYPISEWHSQDKQRTIIASLDQPQTEESTTGMKVFQTKWASGSWTDQLEDALPDAQLVLVFGGKQALAGNNFYQDLRLHFPQAHILTASTSG
jgi:hypothetical protein